MRAYTKRYLNAGICPRCGKKALYLHDTFNGKGSHYWKKCAVCKYYKNIK